MKHSVIILIGSDEQTDAEVHRLNEQHGGSFLLDIYKWDYTSHLALCERVATFNDAPIQRMIIITHRSGITNGRLIDLRNDIQAINRNVHFSYIELP